MALSKQVTDPVEFLFSNSKYHDCYLKVGNPDIDKVETFGVAKIHLIAHSPVFRDMLADSKLADPSGSNTHIKDVSPATFKLMLRYVYGGKLPEMTPEEAADLALCADKYNIQRLVEKAAKQLKPITAEDVFPALMCIVYINCPDLEVYVSKIIQQQTDKVVSNPKFLQLDENCLLFIVKQSMLNIGELELWHNIVRWGEKQVKECPEKTLRNRLNKILQHVRFLSLTSNEILEHVLPKNILTSDEFMDLSLAMSKKQTVQLPGLCKLQEKRKIYNIESVIKQKLDKEIPTLKKHHVFSSKLGNSYELDRCESQRHSAITIKPLVNIEINTLTLDSIRSNPTKGTLSMPFNFTCSISVHKSSMGHFINTEYVSLKSTAFPIENIVLQVKKLNGQPLILEANETYTFQIEMTPSFPVNKLLLNNYPGKVDKTTSWIIRSDFKIKFENPFHVLEIGYTY